MYYVFLLTLLTIFLSLALFSLFFFWTIELLKGYRQILDELFDFTIFVMFLDLPQFAGFLWSFSLTGSTKYV